MNVGHCSLIRKPSTVQTQFKEIKNFFIAEINNREKSDQDTLQVYHRS